MAVPFTYQHTNSFGRIEASKDNSGLSQLFAAAVVNQHFCTLLLNDPQSALKQGYLGDKFNLTREEQALILSIQARSLADLANQVNSVACL
jgi:hypothetical protein